MQNETDHSGMSWDLGPLLCTLKKGWAKGAHLAFLESHLQAYKESDDPSPLELSTTFAKGLSLADTKLKGEVINHIGKAITSWLNYCAQKIGCVSTLKSSKSVDDPISILISRLSGTNKSIPKLKSGWEAWGKANFKSLKSTFDNKFKSMGIPDKGRTAAINKFKKEKFLVISEEEQEQWTQKAITEHKSIKVELKDCQDLPLLLSPQDTQIALEQIGIILMPFACAISGTLGMHCSIILGGPEPKQQGQLNMISIHEGVNKAPVPKVWGDMDKEKFKEVKNQFLAYLAGCYMQAPKEQHARALNPSDTILSAPSQVNNLLTSNPLVLPNDTLPDSTISPAMATTSAAVLGGTRKRKNGHQKSKQCKKQKKFIASDDEEESDGSPTPSDSVHSSNSDHDSDNENDDKEPIPHSMRRRSTEESVSVAGVP